jgi:hypothetical protein
MTTAPSSPPDDPTATPAGSALARLVELALIVPVEVSGRLVEAVPAVVDKVPAAAERVKREVVLARFLGKMVVDQGVRELRARLTPSDDETSGDAGRRAGRAATDPSLPARPESDHETARPRSDSPDVPDVSSLALADYDHLSSAQIVGKLDGLDAAERRAIERYERAARARRTILGKLAQLEASE